MTKHQTIIEECEIRLVNLQTRMPFKYGIATMTRVPHAFVRVRADIGGRSASGIAADLLPPKWFTKDADKPLMDEVRDMMRVIQHASDSAVGLRAGNAFDLWRQLDAEQSRWARTENLPPLLANFGVSLIERGLIEATARALNKPLARLIWDNELGIELGEYHTALRNRAPRMFLSSEPLPRITLRHTVGLLDPLRDDQIPRDQQLNDGLPQSLAACTQAYGLRHFKVKVSGNPDHDLDRLEQIARVLSEFAASDYRFTLDGNEQFHSLADFRAYWNAVEKQSGLRQLLQHLLFVEQPLHRRVALDPEVGQLFEDWAARPAIIIDESDSTVQSVATALSLGYAGASHKNCKGIFKGIMNRCLLTHRAQQTPLVPSIMSGEDLCTIGPVSVLQDLAVMAALGIESVERNGHHYFPGLSMFAPVVQDQVMASHPDLYCRSQFGWPRLDIKEGQIRIESVNRAPFGAGFTLDLAGFTPADQFEPVV